MGKKNDGVTCEVTECVYHEGLNHCIAEKIRVTPCSSNSCDPTTCETFRSDRD